MRNFLRAALADIAWLAFAFTGGAIFILTGGTGVKGRAFACAMALIVFAWRDICYYSARFAERHVIPWLEGRS